MSKDRTTRPVGKARLGRRTFLSSMATTALSLPYYVPERARGAGGRPGANDRLRVGVIGVGIRGKYLISNLPLQAQVVALCDCHLPRAADALQAKGRYRRLLTQFRDGDARSCKTYQDYRKMLDLEKLDAAIVATPDHHHTLAAMTALQAGLDVYVEKALSLTIAEGRQLVRAVNQSGRVCQVGSQNRSIALNRYGCRLIRDGGIGKVSLIELSNYPGPMTYDGLPAEPVPDGLDWELFCGPAPLRRHNRKLWVKDEFMIAGQLWRGWDLWRSYSGHLMTNWGAHSVDMVQFALGTDGTGPVKVWPLVKEHGGEMRFCPVAARYESGVEIRFVFPWADKQPWEFHGEKGKLIMSRNELRTEPVELAGDAPSPIETGADWQGNSSDVVPHLQNWIDCIKSRAAPNAPVEVGHRSVTICHLANMVRQLRREIQWDPRTEAVLGDHEANALLDRPRRPGYELPDMS